MIRAAMFHVTAVFFGASLASAAISEASQRRLASAAPGNEVTVISFNDVYQMDGVSLGSTKLGGLSQAASIIKTFRKRNPERTFVLFAGDLLSPSGLSSLFNGSQMVDTMNELHIDAAALGNHEFDFGVDTLERRIEESNFPWLNVNLFHGEDKSKLLTGTTPRVVRDVEFSVNASNEGRRKARICTFGASYDVRESILNDVERIHYEDIVNASAEEARRLKEEENCTVVFALTHQFNHNDCSLSTHLDKDLDFIFGGHDHEAFMQTNCGNAPVLKADSDLKTVWETSLMLNEDGEVTTWSSTLHAITSDDARDTDVDKVINKWNALSEDKLKEVVGCSSVELDAVKIHVRQRETNLGNVFTDAVRLRHGADAAVYNGGAIRSDKTYPTGKLTKRNVTDMHPFGNTIATIVATGKQLADYIEQSLSCYEYQCGDFLQVSGFKYSFDASKEVGSRLQLPLVWANGTELAEDDQFVLAVSDFIWSTSDLKKCEFYQMVSINDGQLLLQDLFDYIPNEEPNCIKTEVEGRITRLDALEFTYV